MHTALALILRLLLYRLLRCCVENNYFDTINTTITYTHTQQSKQQIEHNHCAINWFRSELLFCISIPRILLCITIAVQICQPIFHMNPLVFSQELHQFLRNVYRASVTSIWTLSYGGPLIKTLLFQLFRWIFPDFYCLSCTSKSLLQFWGSC